MEALVFRLIGIMNHGGLDIGDGWGAYDPSVDMEKQFYDLLFIYEEEAVHGFGQLGLMRPCVRQNLQQLSHEVSSSRRAGILQFKMDYPVIYAALSAMYALYPSASRIAEQEHGGLRAGLSDGISQQRTDCERAYIVNELHGGRHERRQQFLKWHTGENVAKKKRSVPHDKEKWQQRMEAENLLGSLERYSEAHVNSLPRTLQANIAIRNIAKEGILVKDKVIEQQRNKLEDEKDARRKKSMLADEVWEARAADAIVDNDETWVDQDTSQRKVGSH